MSYEVHGEDINGDLWIVRTTRKDTADALAKKFESEGYKNVKIIPSS